jgi:DNA-binding PadR family transcriptional regulator
MPRRLGQATIAILKALRQGGRYGLDLMDRTGLPSGTVYPTLVRMEERGFIRGLWEDARAAAREGRPRRRYYELTTDGNAALDVALREMRALAADAPRPRRAEA